MQNYAEIGLKQKVKVKSYIESLAKDHNSRIVTEMVQKKFRVIISERTVRNICNSIRKDLEQI